MIKSLTDEQKLKFEEYKNKWIQIGLCTKKSNRELAEKHCHEAYKVAGLDEPKLILWAESPIGLLLTAKLIKELSKKYKPYSEMDINSVWDSVGASVGASVGDSVWDSVGASVWDSVRDSVRASVWDSVGASVGASVRASVGASVGDSVWASVGDSVWDSVGASVRASVGASVWDSVWDSVGASVGDSDLRQEWDECRSWGQHDAGWLAFYDYFLEVCDLDVCKKLLPLMNLAEETGWHLFYKDIAILSEKPNEIHLTKSHKLHSETGAAIKWKDGYELYRLNGVSVSKEIALLKPNEVTIDIINKKSNQAARNEIIKKVSFDDWLQRGFVAADGSLQKLISRKEIGEVALFETDRGFVAKRGDTFSHGETSEQAINDLRFKITDRDTSVYDSWKLDDEKTVDELIVCYRVITGACEFGVKDFVQSNKLPDKMKVKTAIRLTKGYFGNEGFEEFFRG